MEDIIKSENKKPGSEWGNAWYLFFEIIFWNVLLGVVAVFVFSSIWAVLAASIMGLFIVRIMNKPSFETARKTGILYAVLVFCYALYKIVLEFISYPYIDGGYGIMFLYGVLISVAAGAIIAAIIGVEKTN